MGGVGVASPQDAVSAVFANPAAMCFTPHCPSADADFMGTIFVPRVKATVSSGGVGYSADGKSKVYPIPALGVSFGFDSLPTFRFGFGAYGVSGMGVDYKGRSIDQNNFFGTNAPLASGTYTDLQIMKFAPSISWQPLYWLSLGMAVHIDYSTLDLRQGNENNFGWGLQFGAIAKPTDQISLGVSYITPQPIKYGDIADFDGDGAMDNLTLESPNQLAFGVAYEPLPQKFLVEANVKWLNWSGAQGYKDFDWSDQWVFAIGAQYRPIPKLALRAGYNYGQSPVKKHSGWDGTQMVAVQDKLMPRYYYESFRVIGFPAITEHHVTAGVGYDITDKFNLRLGFMWAFDNTLTEHGTNVAGQQAMLQSTLGEYSVDLGFVWRF